MDRTQILEKVALIINEKLSVKEVKEELRFVEDLGADSLDLLEIVMAVEDAFQIKIPDEDLAKLKTVGDAVSYVREKTR